MKQALFYVNSTQNKIIESWPAYERREGTRIAHNLLISSLKIVHLKVDMDNVSDNIIRQNLVGDVISSFNTLRSNRDIPIKILFLLVSLNNFSESGKASILNSLSQKSSLRFVVTAGLLTDPQIEIKQDIIFFMSTLAKKSSKAYYAIAELGIFPILKDFLQGDNHQLKGFVCNLLGNLFKHNDYFLDEITKHDIIPLLIRVFKDNAKNCNKYGCYALGNIAYHNNKLYPHLKGAIPFLMRLLETEENMTKGNVAGTLSNFVRNGESLCPELVENKAHEKLIELIEDPNVAESTARIGIFALGNFANYPSVKKELIKCKFVERLKTLIPRFTSNKEVIDLISNIIKKF